MLQNKLVPLIEKCGKVDLIIPVYNEEAILENQLGPVLKQIPDGFMVTVVENGSTDATVSVLNGMMALNANLKVISLSYSSYGNAVKKGLENATSDIVILDDLDVLDTGLWIAGLEIISRGATDMIQGSKIMAGRNDRRPFSRRFATRVLTSLLRLLLGFRGTDTHGVKIIKRSSIIAILPLCGNTPDLYPSELTIRAQRMGLVIRELPMKLEEIRDARIPLCKRVPRAVKDLLRLRSKLGSS